MNGHGAGDVEDERRMDNNQAVMANKQQSIRAWLEPSVENKASSEQAGFAKAGVLGGMAALGELPKGPRKNGENGHKTRIILRQTRDSAAASPQHAASPAPRTPDVGSAGRSAGPTNAHPLPTAAAVESTNLSTPEPHLFPNSPSHNFPASAPNRTAARKALSGHEDAEEDADFDPREANRRRSMPKPAPPKRGRPPSTMRRSSLPPAEKPSPIKQTRPETPRASQPQVVQQPFNAQTSQPTPAPATRTAPDYQLQGAGYAEMVVEAAVDEAITHNRFPTAYALRTLYDTKAGDTGFVEMVERVFSQTADASTMAEFAKLLKEKKREGRKGGTGREYFDPDMDPSDHRLARPAPYARFLYRNLATAPASTGQQPQPVQQFPQVQQAEPAPQQAPLQEEGEGRAQKKLKISHKSQEKTPRKSSSAPVANGARTPGSRKRARRHSGSSASSLSSIGGLSSPELPETSELVPPAGLHDIEQPSFRGEGSRAAATKARAKAAAAAGPQSPSQSGTRPMKTRRKSTKPQQQHQLVSNAFASNSESPTTSLSPAHELPPSTSFKTSGAMPGRVTAAAEQHLSAKEKAAAAASKGTPARSEALSAEISEVWDRRRGAKDVTNGFQALESSVRDEGDGREMTPMRSTRKTRQSVLPSASTRATRSANKKATDEAERFESPGAFSFQGDGPSSIAGSRAVTPTNFRPAKKQKTGLRIKSS